MTQKIQRKLDNLLFTIIPVLPQRMIPGFLQRLIIDRADQRVQEIQEELIRQRWKIIKLQQNLQEIKEAQSQE